jgi:chromosome segregation ATPase
MEKKLLPYLVVISALSVSLSAAFYSVTGIGKMFSGSSTNVMIMMASLEIAKLVLASLLYQYWGKLNNLLKTYYFIAIFVLMIITSGGIYGYLSSAYAETASKLENIEKQVSLLNLKKEAYQTQLNDLRVEKSSLNDDISELTKGLSNNRQNYKDKDGNILTTSSSANRKLFESQLNSSRERRDMIISKESIINDSISNINMSILELTTNTDIAAEIGPLKYIAKITNKSIDVVVNWFIIALMLVFDPLAVSLVVGANVIFADKKKMREKLDLSKQIDDKIKSFKIQESEFESRLKEIEEKEKDLTQKIEKSELDFKEKESKLESEYQEKLNSLDSKEKELFNNYENKEKVVETSFQERKSELEDRVSSREKELQDKLKETTLNLEKIQKEEDKLRDKVRSEESRLKNLEIQLLGEKESIKDEKKVISNLRKEIDKELNTIKEDKKDLELQVSKLEDIKQELSQKERQIELVKDEILKIDSEIKSWESQHWKMKRNPPPSAILD